MSNTTAASVVRRHAIGLDSASPSVHGVQHVHVVGRWAQWLAGLDFLPAMPAGLLMQGNVSQETLQDAAKSYSRERRALHILTTLVKQAEDASELGYRPYANSPVTSVIGPCLFHCCPGCAALLDQSRFPHCISLSFVNLLCASSCHHCAAPSTSHKLKDKRFQ